MRRIFFGISIAALACSSGFAATPEHPAAYDEFIARQAAKHGVPERLVHRVVMRESRYNPRVVHNHCFGMMQIKYGTARSMGYTGSPQGLLDPQVNMTYAIPYLANAYRVADGDEDRAVRLFAGGYYYAAKQKQLLASLRTADSPPLAPDQPPPAPARNPDVGLFAFLLGGPAESAPRVSAPSAVGEAAAQTAAAAYSPAAQNVPAAAPISNPAVASLAQDGAEPASQTAQATPESAPPPPAAHAEKKHTKSAAKSSAAKVAHKQSARANVDLVSAEPSAQSAPATSAAAKPAPKVKATKAHAKPLAVATAQGETASFGDVEAKAADLTPQDAETAPWAPDAHGGKAAKKSEPKAKTAKARAKSIAVAAAKSPALATSDAQTQMLPANADESAR
jgi:Transglycosylase SLT domain